MNTTPIYKVLTTDLKSCMAHQFEKVCPELVVQYKVNEWTFPNLKETALFVFTDLIAVDFFLRCNKNKATDHNWTVWKGEGLNVRPKERIIPCKHITLAKVLSIFRSAIGAFGFKRRRHQRYGFNVADAVRLTEIIPVDKIRNDYSL